MAAVLLDLAFTAGIVEWRGPPPYLFAPVPREHVEAVRDAARVASYGWGCAPVEAEIGGVAFTTSLFPRDNGYLLPVKTAVRRRLDVALGDVVQVTMRIRRPDG